MLISKFQGIQILDVMFDFLPFGYENIFGKDQSYFSYDYNLHITEGVTGWPRERKTEQSLDSPPFNSVYFYWGASFYISDLGSFE